MSITLAEPRERTEWLLRPLFASYQVLEFRGGTIFRGPVSAYCRVHREEVERGLRQFPGNYCFEELGGAAYLTVTTPAPGAKRVNRPLHVVLLLLTVLTTLVAGAQEDFGSFLYALGASLVGAEGSMPPLALGRSLVVQGGLFSMALLLILGSHELGHYFMARRYGMLVTPPFFLPAPIPPIGTFGAVIKMRSPMLHRRALLDIGLAGPLAGLAVALPFLLFGLTHARMGVPHYWEPHGGISFGHSLLTWGLSRVLLGAPPPAHVVDWLSHPFAWAGWIGLLVTSLNLLPVGQLDGGHVAYALVGRRQRYAAYFAFGLLIALTRLWVGWVVWCVVMGMLMKVAHPPVVIDDVRLGPGRRLLGWAAMALLLLVFVPAPVGIWELEGQGTRRAPGGTPSEQHSRRQPTMERVNVEDKDYRKGDSGPKYLFRGPRIDWGVLRFLPGQELGTHHHEKVEETFYFTRGTPKVVVNGEEHRARVGDAFRMEPGDVHNIVNDTDGPIDAVFIKSDYLPDDKVSG